MRFFEKQYDSEGREIPDPRPMAVPFGWDRPLTLAEQIKRMVRVELSREAAANELESFEEADDFDVDEDMPEFTSAYEVRDLIPEEPTANAAPPAAPGGASAPPGATAPAPATPDKPVQGKPADVVGPGA